MSTGTRIPLAEAAQVAADLITLLRPDCEQIAVAGSVRRGKPDVGDIEILAVPKMIEQPMAQLTMFDDAPEVEYANALNERTDILVGGGDGIIKKLPDFISKWGEKYRNFTYRGVKIDLFQARADSWGIQYAIRTGPHEFSKRLVTQREKGGFLPNLWRVKGGSVWSGPERKEFRTEEELFDAIGLEYIEPNLRS